MKKFVIYLFVVINLFAGDTIVNKSVFELTETNTTCPVRFVDVKKYPSYSALIIYKDGKKEFFSSPKYMFRYYYDNENIIKEAFVADFITTKFVNVKNSYFVYGSNLMSIGGDDLIAFDSEAKA
ncbi:MAG: nitrous oxide reductase accessory protein NosL, partial [Epsilonproteobacteria bacterium]|nr:nitrous oxide reductase accessory protein NosL [Campylobacterota bacterium]